MNFRKGDLVNYRFEVSLPRHYLLEATGIVLTKRDDDGIQGYDVLVSGSVVYAQEKWLTPLQPSQS